MKLVGFIEMKKKKGKVLFVVDEEKRNGVTGYSTDKLFIYDDLADKVNASSVGKKVSVFYTAGYNGKAYITDISLT